VDGIDLASHGRIRHIRSKSFTDENSTNMIERFQGVFKQRSKVFRHFTDLDTARLLTEGWLIHYNFFKEHEGLDNMSPARHMKVAMPFQDWTDIVRHSSAAPIRLELGKERPMHRPHTEEQKAKAYHRKAARKSFTKKKRLLAQSISVGR